MSLKSHSRSDRAGTRVTQTLEPKAVLSPSGGHQRLMSAGGTPPVAGTAGWLSLCGEGAGSEFQQDLAKATQWDWRGAARTAGISSKGAGGLPAGNRRLPRGPGGGGGPPGGREGAAPHSKWVPGREARALPGREGEHQGHLSVCLSVYHHHQTTNFHLFHLCLPEPGIHSLVRSFI